MGDVWAHCKTKMICGPGDPKEEGAGPKAEELEKGHGGMVVVQYKKNKDDGDVCFEPIFFQDSACLTSL